MSINTGSKVKLLVTTALEKTRGEKQDILFIGEWCKPYKIQAEIRKRNHQTMPFHWSDRQKKYKEYELDPLFKKGKSLNISYYIKKIMNS